MTISKTRIIACVAAALSLAACQPATGTMEAGEAPPNAEVITAKEAAPVTQPQNGQGSARVLYASDDCDVIEFTTPDGERYALAQGYKTGCSVIPLSPRAEPAA
jgi:hypothetical protein